MEMPYAAARFWEIKEAGASLWMIHIERQQR
jgi:hypothetical protein